MAISESPDWATALYTHFDQILCHTSTLKDAVNLSITSPALYSKLKGHLALEKCASPVEAAFEVRARQKLRLYSPFRKDDDDVEDDEDENADKLFVITTLSPPAMLESLSRTQVLASVLNTMHAFDDVLKVQLPKVAQAEFAVVEIELCILGMDVEADKQPDALVSWFGQLPLLRVMNYQLKFVEYDDRVDVISSKLKHPRPRYDEIRRRYNIKNNLEELLGFMCRDYTAGQYINGQYIRN